MSALALKSLAEYGRLMAKTIRMIFRHQMVEFPPPDFSLADKWPTEREFGSRNPLLPQFAPV
jgi:hypothetical protein